MRVISRKRLREFWQQRKDAELPLKTWYKTAIKADWDTIKEAHQTCPQADAVPLKCGLIVTVFNIGGNKYRLITRTIYQYRRIYVKRILTHAEYDKEKWKAELCREHQES